MLTVSITSYAMCEELFDLGFTFRVDLFIQARKERAN